MPEVGATARRTRTVTARDIEELGLVAFDPDTDPSMRVFPHQDLDGSPLPAGQRTQPNLRPRG